jgi:putative protein kinase ArgK-like GTPase of G3E family
MPDVFVVNKADLGVPARQAAAELAGGIGLAESPDPGWERPVLLVSARDNTGIDDLVRALSAHREALTAGGALRERRQRGRESWLLAALERRYGSFGLERCGGAPTLRARIAERGASSSFTLLGELSREIEDVLRKPA